MSLTLVAKNFRGLESYFNLEGCLRDESSSNIKDLKKHTQRYLLKLSKGQKNFKTEFQSLS